MKFIRDSSNADFRQAIPAMVLEIRPQSAAETRMEGKEILTNLVMELSKGARMVMIVFGRHTKSYNAIVLSRRPKERQLSNVNTTSNL